MGTLAGQMTRPRQYALAVELTSFCNQKCGYCYNGFREDGGKATGALPTPTLVRLLDRALTEVEFDHVTLTGGEPFARADLFEIIDVCARHRVRFQMISNGGVISDAHAERLAPYRPLFVQITLDGPNRELHEAHVGRVVSASPSGRGLGHWDKTMNGIAALRRHGVTIAGSIVVTRKNARHVGETLAVWRDLGVKMVALSRFSPAGYAARNVAELLPSRTELIAALEQAELAGAQHGMQLQVTMPVPQCVVDHADYPHVRFGGCPIGTSMQELALGPRGELRNCTLHEEVIGHLDEAPLPELMKRAAVTAYRDVTPEFCAPCPHRKTCLGGCGAAAVATMGDRTHVDPFVAQHVEDAFRERLVTLRRTKLQTVEA